MWQVPGLTLQPKGISEKHSANKDLADLGTDGPTALCEQEKGQTNSREVLWAWEDVMWKRTFRIAWTGGLREMEATINFLFEWKQSQKSLSLLFLTNTCYMIGSTAFNFGHNV